MKKKTVPQSGTPQRLCASAREMILREQTEAGFVKTKKFPILYRASAWFSHETAKGQTISALLFFVTSVPLCEDFRAAAGCSEACCEFRASDFRLL